MVRALKLLEDGASFLALGGIVAAVLWGAATRYIAPQPAIWTGEVSGFLLTWVVFLGAMRAHRRDEHIRVTILIDAMPPKLRRLVTVGAEVILLLFLVYSTYLAVEMTIQGASRPSVALRLPFAFVYVATAIAFFIMTATTCMRILTLARAEASTGAPL